jgi:hypothetical protein
MPRWERAAARMATRDVRRHPHVADWLGRLHYWRAESNGRLPHHDEDGDGA